MPKKFVDLSTMNVYADVGVKFVLAICLAWVVTKFIEKPLLAKGKEWEKKLK